MAIVRMNRLRGVMLSRQRKKVLKDFSRLGCVEIEMPAWSDLAPAEVSAFQQVKEYSDVSRVRNELLSALDALAKYAPEKKPMFAPPRYVGEATLFDQETMAQAIKKGEAIGAINRQITEMFGQEGRMEAQKAALAPWRAVNIPLDYAGGDSFSTIFGVCPNGSEADAACKALTAGTLPAVAAVVAADGEQQYIIVLVHKTAEDEALSELKSIGFSKASLKDIHGTAAENIAALDVKMADSAAARAKLATELCGFADAKPLLEQTVDALSVELMREEALSSMVQTESTTYFEGWVPEETKEAVAAALEKHGCAYEFAEPREDETPPTALKNGSAVEPFGSITELYGLPAYNSVIDPNPLVALFFFLFFGVMLADTLYGLVLAAGAFYVYKKVKPTGAFRKFMIVAVAVGISGVFWGVFFGSWFGDFPTALGNMFGQQWKIPAIGFDPLAEPITMLMLSLGFGVIHLFIGMWLSAWRMIKQGQWMDAIFDIGFWYLIVGGLIVALIGIGAGLYIAVVGALGVFLTAGRSKPSIFGKITGGLGALYGVTSYLSDILSYSRLMALGLSAGVVAQVLNTLGSLGGSTVIGWILFIIVFIFGHIFNLAISLLSAFVHTCRLQYVEFFGKFFEGGGRAFTPLYNKTKYIRVIKEEN